MKWIAGLLFLSIIITGGVAAVMWYQAERQEFATHIPLQIGDTEWSVRVADSQWEQRLGFQGIQTIGAHEGMVFVFEAPEVRSVWMKNTLVDLDVVWVADGAVVGITPNIQPQSGVPDDQFTVYRSPQSVDSFVEIPAGQASVLGISIGDIVVFNTP